MNQINGDGIENIEAQRSNRNDGDNRLLGVTVAYLMTHIERQEKEIEKLKKDNTERDINILGTNEDIALRRFLKLNPPRFSGESGVEEAERLIETMAALGRGVSMRVDRFPIR